MRILGVGIYGILFSKFALFDAKTSIPGWAYWLSLYLLVDLAYYWAHRYSHEINLFWGGHVVHHQSEDYNLSVALRQSSFQVVWTFAFSLPIAILGYDTKDFVYVSALNTLYQFWIHTEVVRRLPGPLERLLNTPSHHRVHHGKNLAYLDRNHGGVLIVWDRLFGTFAAEDEREPVRYGITHDIQTFNPLRVAVHELVAMARDVRRAGSLRAVLGYLFAPPGWSPDGSSQTAGQLRRQQKPVSRG